MKLHTLIIITGLFFTSVGAQDNLSTDSTHVLEKDSVYVIVQKMPAFSDGGISEFNKYIIQNVIIPEILPENAISTKIVIRFVINKEGLVQDVEILRGIYPALDEEFKRVVESSPRWEPGKEKGIPVNVQYILPIELHFQ